MTRLWSSELPHRILVVVTSSETSVPINQTTRGRIPEECCSNMFDIFVIQISFVPICVFFKEIYCTENIYSVYKDKLQNFPVIDLNKYLRYGTIVTE